MKIKFEDYNPNWTQSFESIKKDLSNTLYFANPEIEHIGSTAVDGLIAKPIIDVLIGISNKIQLDEVVKPMVENEYVYNELFNKEMPYRRFFIKYHQYYQELKFSESENEHNFRLAHIHILHHNSEHWIRHIAFRDYLRAFSDVREEYLQLKKSLSTKDWINGIDYNKAKDSFLKTEEKKAVEWFKQ